MVEIDLSEFVHGGVNITGFTLLDVTQPKAQALLKEWGKPNHKYWQGANGNRKLRVSGRFTVLCVQFELTCCVSRVIDLASDTWVLLCNSRYDMVDVPSSNRCPRVSDCYNELTLNITSRQAVISTSGQLVHALYNTQLA